MSLYTRARKHIDMRRVKEMREEKIREEVIAELERQQQEILAELKEIESQESKSCDWRKELHERMTSSGTLLTTLPATGDVDIVNNRSALNGFDGQNYGISSAGTVTLTDDGDNDIVDGTHTAFRQAFYTVDGSKSSHLKITISKGGGTSSWTDRGESWDDDVTLVVSDIDNFHAPTYSTSNLTSGTHVIKLPGQYKNMRVQVQQFAKLASDGSPGTTRSLKIYNVSLQRRTPLNVFVGLDEPNSAAFVRDGDFERLSPTEKKKKLEEQLKASDEYLKKQFGEGMPRTATKIADYEPQQSFMDIQAGGQRITKRDGRTITDTTRGIRGGKMDGRPTYTDRQGNLRVSQPKVDLSPEDLRSISRKTGGSYSGKSDRTSITNVPKTSTFKPYTDAEKAEKDFGLTSAQMGKIATNVAGGTAFNPSLRAIGSQGRGLGGEVKIGQHGTGPKAAQGIKKTGFRPGSRQNVYGRSGVFIDPSKSGAAADEFARAGAAAEAGGRRTAGRSAAQRSADLRAAGKSTGEKIPVAYKPGTGSRMNIPGTKYTEVGMSADKATRGARLAQNAATKYPNSAKATQLITKGATTAKVGAARGLAKTLGKAVPFAGAAISVADAADRFSKGDVAGGIMSGLTAVPGPIGWAALGAQIVYDTSRSKPTSSIRGRSGAKRGSTSGTSGARRGSTSFMDIKVGDQRITKEEKEYGSYQDYVDRAKETIDKKKIKLDKGLLDVLKTELGLSDKLSDEDKEYLVDLFDNSEDVDPDEAMKFIKKIQKKLTNGNSIKEQVLTEKKRLKSPKSIVDKIPGYYDGKPAPLGFPVEEPPKMKNGYHPDLVDGKKVSNRYNRLDPISAKSMPPTGNPHIDKKVKAARKKPK